MSIEIQEIMHKAQSGAGARLFRVLFVLIVVSGIAGLYDLAAFRNLAQPQAMDMAQLGRNLAEGRGFCTLFVRPLSMHLVQRHRAGVSSEMTPAHPDLANPPVYPLLLAGLFKAMPARFFAVPEKGFGIYLPDLAISLLNQGLLLVAALLLFSLAGKFFDRITAWTVSIVFVGTESFWRYSVSGLNTLLLVVLLLAVVRLLVQLEQWVRLGRGNVLLVTSALGAGVLIGLGGLTRYAFGWFLLPVLVYLAVFFREKRAQLSLAMLAGFLAMLAPWMARNYARCGLPFGTASFAVVESTVAFPEERLQRTLHPDLRAIKLEDLARKFLRNSRALVQEDLPRLGGSWVSAFFLVGLLVPFRNPALAHLRWLLLAALGVFGVAQVMGRTALSGETMEVSPENMLVLLAPLVLLYGVALFFVLIESVDMPFQAARAMLVAGFCLVASLPLVQALLPPHPGPVAYPPYYPPLIQRVASWFDEREMLMSDVPWAVAWYGRRQCVWATLNWQKEFVEITDFHKPIKGLYLTPLTTDSRFLSNWVQGSNRGWATFLLESIVQREVPSGFPLRRAPEGFFPEQVLLTDYERWKLRRE